MDEFDKSAMRETMSEVYDRMTAGAAEEEAEREAEREYLSSLSEEEFAKETRRQLEAIWDKHHPEEATNSIGDNVNVTTRSEAPSHWRESDRERFSQLPPGAQEIVLDHVGSLERGILDRLASETSTASDSRWTGYLSNLGATPETALDGFLTIDHALRFGLPDQKRNTLWQLARDFGVDVLGPSVTQSNPAAAMLQQQLREAYTANQRLADERNARRRASNERIVQEFRSRSVDGRKMHPHFDSVEEDMARLLKVGRASSLKEAYTMAVSMRPELRKKR